MDNFDMVDQKALSNMVEERFRVLESVDELEESFDFRATGFTGLSSSGNNLSSLAEESDTFFNLFWILGPDVFNTTDNIISSSLDISNADLNLVKDGSTANTLEETFNELKDISLGVTRNVHVVDMIVNDPFESSTSFRSELESTVRDGSEKEEC